ncbi:MAG: hypothetical protein A2066_14395 [Bacteroidetes bacterium GWB2_41_8]|nr:MAG: hypothetical protein A2066_14395 [Bacteroidetes bacterium GWB2_41_8]
MDIPIAVMKKRQKLAIDLRKLAGVLYEYFPTADLSSIESATTQLRDLNFIPQIHREASNSNFWGYNLNRLIFNFDTLPRHTRPLNCIDLKLILDINAVGDCMDLGNLNDPFKWLEFNIVIEGTKFGNKKIKQVSTSYHLDRHIFNEDDGEPEFAHPIYHFQFGGRKLAQYEGLKTGDLLILDSPRIGHYPMEAILGIDFILSNFFPKRWGIMRSESSEYINLVEEYQELILKPYVHTHASKWQYLQASIVNNNFWNHAMICPQLI